MIELVYYVVYLESETDCASAGQPMGVATIRYYATVDGAMGLLDDSETHLTRPTHPEVWMSVCERTVVPQNKEYK